MAISNSSQSTLIKNAQVFDGKGGPVSGPMSGSVPKLIDNAIIAWWQAT